VEVHDALVHNAGNAVVENVGDGVEVEHTPDDGHAGMSEAVTEKDGS
jgi:hypothetical protein